MKHAHTSAIRTLLTAFAIAGISLLFTATVQAQENGGYRMDLSGFNDSDFPMNVTLTYSDGTTQLFTMSANGASEAVLGDHGAIISAGGDGGGGTWFVNNPPGPNLPPAKEPVIPHNFDWCYHYWWTWEEIPDAGGNGLSLWIQVMHVAVGPC